MCFSVTFLKTILILVYRHFMEKLSQYIFQGQKERKYPDNLWFFFSPITEKKKTKQTPERFFIKKDFFAWKGQVMFLNFNMLINCQIIISMELNLNFILIFN